MAKSGKELSLSLFFGVGGIKVSGVLHAAFVCEAECWGSLYDSGGAVGDVSDMGCSQDEE